MIKKVIFMTLLSLTVLLTGCAKKPDLVKQRCLKTRVLYTNLAHHNYKYELPDGTDCTRYL